MMPSPALAASKPATSSGTRVAPLLLLVLLPLASPGAGGAQDTTPSRPPSPPDGAEALRPYPDLRPWREVALLGSAAALEVAIRVVRTSVRPVPAAGFDPREIDWGVDRGVLGRGSRRVDAASDRTRDAATLLPIAVGLATSWHDPARELPRRALVYAETALLVHGLTYLGKEVFGRPRPYAYLAADARPDHAGHDLADEGTFQSMPSGHSSSAWAAVSLGVTEHLLARPNAPGWERAGVGFLAGALAGSTAALRVEAGQHFPSDVIAGAAIGVASGVAVPLLHRGASPWPRRTAWLQATAGTIAGTLVGVLAARSY